MWKVGFCCGVERDSGLWNGFWKIFSRWVVRYEPQATAVELAQLGGEGGFPTVWGNVPKGQKGKASFKNGGQAVPLNEVLIRWY